ncbi:GMC family oxidoreductase [Pendulispora albinea]|uniref:GMC family oxidoreductase n=1 Tax=Pendulispora albinea TaxID=2741071 RepID=A0ABZ2LXW8_9BACT
MRVLIVGAGSAGLTCAWRLAREPSTEVVLIDAGVDPGPDVPSFLLRDMVLPPPFYWDYAEFDRGYFLPRGKLFGGTSAVNATAAVRGHPWCYDAWGSPSWRWERCLPSFRAIEADMQFGAEPYHGHAGPVPITRCELGGFDHALGDAYVRRGLARIADHNAPGHLGFGPFPTNRIGDDRASTLRTLLPELRGRPNVTLRPQTEAVRVVMAHGEARGVLVRTAQGDEQLLEADRVVLSGGTFGSPEMLFASGIGPADGLRTAGLPVHVDAPEVGANLVDHPYVQMGIEVSDPAKPAAPPGKGALLTFELDGPGHLQAHAFAYRTRAVDPSADPCSAAVTCALLTPESRGRLELGTGRARVRLNHLSSDVDARRMAEIVARVADVVADLASEGALRLPADPWWHADDLPAACRREVVTYHHPVGTCRMGSDTASVVDEALRVRGVERLMVADASVMPSLPRGQTNLGAMMIGHRAAEFLLEAPPP